MTLLNTLDRTNILTLDKASEIVEGLNADTEDECTYKVERKDHGYAIAVFDEDGEFAIYL